MKYKDTTEYTTEKRDWATYNQSLVDRGGMVFTVYLDTTIGKRWYGGGRYTYSDDAIQFVLTVQQVFRLPLRAVTGFLQGLFKGMDIQLPVPDYTTVSRRVQNLSVSLNKQKKETVAMVIDSTGLKVYGEGEWKVRKHGYTKRRVWKKVHITLDTDGEIRTVEVTDNTVHDRTPAPTLITRETASITDFYGDGAYDTTDVYDLFTNLPPPRVRIPPRKDAVLGRHPIRDHTLTTIIHTSLKAWKQDSGYHTRSLAETTMYRLKTTFGPCLSYRNPASQKNEVLTRCSILNDFNQLTLQKQKTPS